MPDCVDRQEILKMIDERAENAILKWERTEMQPRHDENRRALEGIREQLSLLSRQMRQIYGNGTGQQGILDRMQLTLDAYTKEHDIEYGERKRVRQIKDFITWTLGLAGMIGGILEIILKVKG
jgi:hypothetical protein